MNKSFINQKRVRSSKHIRELSSDVLLHQNSFIQPIFIQEGLLNPTEIIGLNDNLVHNVDSMIYFIDTLIKNGINKILIFPIPNQKCSKDFNFDFACSIVKKIKAVFKSDIWIAMDLCLCSYTLTGHCGILNKTETTLLNSETIEILCRYALELSIAGADCIAPSDMTDGRIARIREILNIHNFEETIILSYAAKFSSQYYGPFRDACNSAPKTNGLQNRKSYQISPSNKTDALACLYRDAAEGADILMIKPATLYLDIIKEATNITYKPIAAYQVSGEYASIEFLAQNNLVNKSFAHIENWTAIKRAGAQIIISYAAQFSKKWIEQIEY